MFQLKPDPDNISHPNSWVFLPFDSSDWLEMQIKNRIRASFSIINLYCHWRNIRGRGECLEKLDIRKGTPDQIVPWFWEGVHSIWTHPPQLEQGDNQPVCANQGAMAAVTASCCWKCRAAFEIGNLFALKESSLPPFINQKLFQWTRWWFTLIRMEGIEQIYLIIAFILYL